MLHQTWELFVQVYNQIPTIKCSITAVTQWRTEGEGGFGVFNPPPEIPKALQNCAKLNPIVKTVKNCWI